MDRSGAGGGELLAHLSGDTRMTSFEAFWDAVPENVSLIATAQADAAVKLSAANQVPVKEEAAPAGAAVGSTRPANSGGSLGEASSAEAQEQEQSSRYRGVSYDKKKRKWRVQIKIASLGKSGVSVGYFDTELSAARAYDKAAIGLLGRDGIITNFPIDGYKDDEILKLDGLTREEVKATLKTERTRTPKSMLSNRRRTSRYLGVGSSNRKNQWQARILIKGKVTHLGYYGTEQEAARVYDRVCLNLNGTNSSLNFPAEEYKDLPSIDLSSSSREDLQRSLGVKPMDKSSKFRGVSRKKGKWEAKVMLHRKWAYRELFDNEEDAARAYDQAVWRLKPNEARAYVNFKDDSPDGSPVKAESPGQGVAATASPSHAAHPLTNHPAAISSSAAFGGSPRSLGSASPQSPFSPNSPTSQPASPAPSVFPHRPSHLGRPMTMCGPLLTPANSPADSPASTRLDRPSCLSGQRGTSELLARAAREVTVGSIQKRAQEKNPQQQQQPKGQQQQLREQLHKAMSLERGPSVGGMDWLENLASVRDGRGAFNPQPMDFNSAVAAAIQELGAETSASAPSSSAPHAAVPMPSPLPLDTLVSPAVRSPQSLPPTLLNRQPSIATKVRLNLDCGGAAACDMELPQPRLTPPMGTAGTAPASSARVVEERSSCHLNFRHGGQKSLNGVLAMKNPAVSALQRTRRCVSDAGAPGRAEPACASPPSPHESFLPTKASENSPASVLLGDLMRSAQSASAAEKPSPFATVSLAAHSTSMGKFRELLAQGAVSRRPIWLPATKPTITTGLDRSTSMPARATGRLVSELDAEVLDSTAPVMQKLDRCNSLVAQEILITRTMSQDAKALKTTTSPFGAPAVQDTSTARGQLPPRSSSFSCGLGNAAQMRQRLAKRNASPLGPFAVGQATGLVSLLSRVRSFSGGAPQRREFPKASEPLTRGWPVVSGVPILMRSLSSAVAPMSSPNSDFVPRSQPWDGMSSDSEDEDEAQDSLQPLGHQFALRAFASHDGTYQ